MSLRAALRSIDATIVASLRAAGLADQGSYTPPAGAVVEGIDLLIDRSVALYDDQGTPVDLDAVLVTLFLDQVAAPEAGGVVTCGDETFELVRPEKRDVSAVRWVVGHG
jgi:hypothetical protein